MRIQHFLLLPLCFATVPLHAQQAQLPFTGRWFVMQGGDTPNVNSHMQLESQWFAVDFAKVGGVSGRQLAPGTPTRLEDFYGWGAEVRAPVDGTVVEVEDGLPDNHLGTHDPVHPLGNHVELRSGDDYFYLAHFQRGSLQVKQGDRVLAGTVLGLCGNSRTFPISTSTSRDHPTSAMGVARTSSSPTLPWNWRASTSSTLTGP